MPLSEAAFRIKCVIVLLNSVGWSVSHQKLFASQYQQICCNSWVFQIELALLHFPKPPALQLHCRAACPAHNLCQNGLANACTKRQPYWEGAEGIAMR